MNVSSTCYTHIVSFWVEPFVVSGDYGRLNLATGGNTVCLRTEGEQRRSVACAGELELSQVMDKEVERGGH